jgi:hypothetical protein
MVIGEFCYFGVATGLQMLRRTIGSALHNFVKIFKLQINIDGLPLFKSSCAQLWSILCLVKKSENDKPFCGKLVLWNRQYVRVLEDFIYEINDLLGNGLLFKEKHSGVVDSFIFVRRTGMCLSQRY